MNANRDRSTIRFKVTLPASLGIELREAATARGQSVSRVAAEAIASGRRDTPNDPPEHGFGSEIAAARLRLSIAILRSVSALIAMAPRPADEAGKAQIAERAAGQRATVLAHLGLDEDELLALADAWT